MFCDDVVCDNGESVCLFLSFEAEKFPFKNLKGKISQKVYLFCLFCSSVLFVSWSYFERVWCFSSSSFPPPIKEREEERGKPNEDTVHHSKQSESIQNQLCVRVDIHTFLQIVL